jgi:putative ABC transport system permease protein
MNRFVSWGEVRLAVRLIVKQPVLSGTIVLALATGICLTTMGFTLREALVNSVLPYQAGDRFIRVFLYDKDGRTDPGVELYHALRDRAAATVELVAAASGRPFTVTSGDGEVESVMGTMVTPRAMRWLDASPVLGRTFIPSDGDAGAERVALIRESYWRNRFNGDPSAIGRQLMVNGLPRTIVGVMPDSFEFNNSGELWLPLDEPTLAGSARGVFGVLREGATVEAAAAEMNRIRQEMPGAGSDPPETRLVVRGFTADSSNANIAMSALVFVLVLLLLVVASNIATLVFARTWARAPELVVRTALGASRSRVVGQLFMESLVIGGVAAVIGVAAAFAGLRYIAAMAEGMPFWVTLQPSGRGIAFVVFLTLLIGMVSGMLPALRVTRHDLRQGLQAGRGFAVGGFGRVGATMLVVEIALSIALLNGAVAMTRAFQGYFEEVPALPVNQVLTVHLGRIRDQSDRDRIVDTALSLPGVVAAGASQSVPRLYPSPLPTLVEAMDDEPLPSAGRAPTHPVGNGFLEAIGARPVAGRLFTAADFLAGAAPVVVVNEPFVQKFLGGRQPIGRRIRIDQPTAEGAARPWMEIVGVVPDLGLSVGDPEMRAGYYTPAHDEMLWYLAIRASVDPTTLISPLRAAVARLDPDLQLQDIRPLEEADREERAFLAGIAGGLTAMGGMALLLSIVGIYALLSFMVTRRTREIGIRVALGARHWQVLQSITGGAALYLAIGGLLGSVLGVLFVQMRSLILVSIPAPGFWMPATIFLTLAFAGLTACWLPARRALSIKPAEALNSD